MTFSIAYLGPVGTYTETAALAYTQWLKQTQAKDSILCPYPSIAQTLDAVAKQEADFAVVPVENSTEGSVAVTLDTLWQLEGLQIQKALVLPIHHCLLSPVSSVEKIKTIYSHPQALAQCQKTLESYLPQIQLVPTASTAEALQLLKEESNSGAIASSRAAQLYKVPIIISSLNDYPDNCTRFWAVGLNTTTEGTYLSLGFTTPENEPGALVRPLAVFAQREINLTRIESRPTKRSLGEYLFFIDIAGSLTQSHVQAALADLPQYTEVLKIFGNYEVLSIEATSLV